MSITASDHAIDIVRYQADAAKYLGMDYTHMIVDEWDYMTKPMSTNIDDYEIRRLGRKDYGVFHTAAPNSLRARYACSHTEAKRRWALKLVTHRLTK